MYKIIGCSPLSYGIKEIVADTEADLETIEVCEMGSQCLILENSKIFIRNSAGEWKHIINQ